MTTQRIITGNDLQGQSYIVSNGPVPGDASFVYQPGFSAAVFAQTDTESSVGSVATSALKPITKVLPSVGGTTALIVTFPPAQLNAQQVAVNPQALAQEMEEKLPGFAEIFEPEAPGFHQTDTIDYAVLIEGELTLILDNDQRAQLKRGDVVVQNGTRHAWVNNGKVPARVMFVMVGVTRK